ncbi:phosphate ABC transporter substrate-binding protein PstS [Brevibacterium ravenspurgense]|uniref:phosphate ABC transporter substrate-binding protein PstS n=1 Tax=Brevibacterium ravenspurgense TaxID=479117 RepID=UPI0002D2EC44|nr:phosphate ABC transporter substrate-binding protein PstS [Brevibacterium ravenspurgense]
MKLTRLAPAAAAFAAAAITLSACGGGSATGESGGGNEGGDQVSGELVGIGASSQKAAIQSWTTDFTGQNSDVTVNYSPDGSGAGRKQFLAGKADFAGSDAFMDDDELEQANEVCGDGGAFEFPVYISPIAIAYNLEGVDELNLDAATAAQIFAGKITKWNDKAIADLNPDADLPDTKITAVHRSDESGTTKNFTDYLNKAAGEDWKDEAAEEFPSEYGGEAAQGTDGVVSLVSETDGAIGYADASAVADDLGTAKIKVGEDFVEYTPEAAAKVVDASPVAEGRGEGDIAVELKRDTEEAGAYPIVLVSYHIVCSSYDSQEKVDLVKAWENFVVSEEGQESAAESAGSAPISSEMRDKITSVLDKIEVKK